MEVVIVKDRCCPATKILHDHETTPAYSPYDLQGRGIAKLAESSTPIFMIPFVRKFPFCPVTKGTPVLNTALCGRWAVRALLVPAAGVALFAGVLPAGASAAHARPAPAHARPAAAHALRTATHALRTATHALPVIPGLPAIPGVPAAAAGDDTLSGAATVKTSNGRLQVTYQGHALYTYFDDGGNSTSGVGLPHWVIALEK